MARRLISPAAACRGCGFVKSGFLGAFSSFHYQSLPSGSSKRNSSVKNCSTSYRANLRNQGSRWIRSNPSLSLNSTKFGGKRTSCSVATEAPPAATEEPEMDAPKEILLKDYKKPDYLFDTVDLQFQLGEEKTIVTSKIVVSPGTEGQNLCL